MTTRSRLEIYLDLLLAVSENTDLTIIADKIGLSTPVTKRHLAFLVSQGLVANKISDDQPFKYVLTVKGFEALMAFLKLTGREESVIEEKLNA